MTLKTTSSPAQGSCGCRWKSSLCSYQFDYEVFKVLETRGGLRNKKFKKKLKNRYFIYLNVHVLPQKCQKHKRPAQEVQILEEFEKTYSSTTQLPVLPKLWRDFSNYIMPMIYTHLETVPVKSL